MQVADIDSAQYQSLLRNAFDAIHDCVAVLDLDYNIVLANRHCEISRPYLKPLAGKKCYRVFHDRTEPCPDCPYEKTIATGAASRGVFESELRDRSGGWFETFVQPLDDEHGNVVGAVEHCRDITARRRAGEQLRDEITRRRLLVEQSRDGIVVLDERGDVYEANEAFAHMLGYTLDETHLLNVFDWEVAFPKEVVLQMLSEVDGKGDQFETRHKRKDGSFIEVEISTNGAVYNGKKLVFCVCRDVTEKNALKRQIEQLAIRDPLTEIYNRRYVFDRLSEIVAEYRREGIHFCISILDIDHFKTINDTYGHPAGDFILKEFSDLIGSMIRPYDLLGRYGGEEFVVISKNTRAVETRAIIERIMDTVRETSFVFGEHMIRFTFSCGLMESAEFSRDELSTDEAIALADERLYKAKDSGRDRCVGPTAGGPQLVSPLVARKWRMSMQR